MLLPPHCYPHTCSYHRTATRTHVAGRERSSTGYRVASSMMIAQLQALAVLSTSAINHGDRSVHALGSHWRCLVRPQSSMVIALYTLFACTGGAW